MKCIYKIVCRDTNIKEFYIGSSVNFNKRKNHHKSNSTNLNRREYCYPLYMFINVNGGFDNWKFEIIKEYNLISKKELEINEQAYIELLKPQLNSINAVGYNMERRKNRKKIHNKFKANCPHCNKLLIKNNIKRHIKTQHPTI